MKDGDVVSTFDTNILEYKAKSEDIGLELKDILYERLKLSSRLVRKLKRNKSILVNEYKVSLSTRIRKNDCIKVILPVDKNEFVPEDIPLDIEYEDQDIMIINKQPNIVVHPTKGHPYGTIANGIVKYIEDTKQNFKIRFVNRLDRDTSGLMIVAKNAFSQQNISMEMQEDSVVKEYVAVVEGKVKENSGVINEPIGRLNEEDIVRVVTDTGQDSITYYEVLNRFKDATLVRIRLGTGRTHQIRVHMKHLGHPLLGDELYGGDMSLISRQALHSVYVEFNQPRTGERLYIESELPYDIQELIRTLSK